MSFPRIGPVVVVLLSAREKEKRGARDSVSVHARGKKQREEESGKKRGRRAKIDLKMEANLNAQVERFCHAVRG